MKKGAKTVKICKHSVRCPTPHCENCNSTYQWREKTFYHGFRESLLFCVCPGGKIKYFAGRIVKYPEKLQPGKIFLKKKLESYEVDDLSSKWSSLPGSPLKRKFLKFHGFKF